MTILLALVLAAIFGTLVVLCLCIMALDVSGKIPEPLIWLIAAALTVSLIGAPMFILTASKMQG